MNPATGPIRIIDPVFEPEKSTDPAIQYDMAVFSSQRIQVQIIGLVVLVLVAQFGAYFPMTAGREGKLCLSSKTVEPSVGRLLAEPGCGAPGSQVKAVGAEPGVNHVWQQIFILAHLGVAGTGGQASAPPGQEGREIATQTVIIVVRAERKAPTFGLEAEIELA